MARQRIEVVISPFEVTTTQRPSCLLDRLDAADARDHVAALDLDMPMRRPWMHGDAAIDVAHDPARTRCGGDCRGGWTPAATEAPSRSRPLPARRPRCSSRSMPSTALAILAAGSVWARSTRSKRSAILAELPVAGFGWRYRRWSCSAASSLRSLRDGGLQRARSSLAGRAAVAVHDDLRNARTRRAHRPWRRPRPRARPKPPAAQTGCRAGAASAVAAAMGQQCVRQTSTPRAWPSTAGSLRAWALRRG